jgi:hypothetical protein
MEQFHHAICQSLREAALRLPETSEGTSCVNRAFKVRKKNFLYVGEKGEDVRVMVKLGPSVDKAEALADPRIQVGMHGWTTVRFSASEAPDTELLLEWVLESFRNLAPKALVKELDR